MPTIGRTSSRIYNAVSKRLRFATNLINRGRLKNHNLSLISSNCNGGFILHDLNMEFLTPTINLFFYAGDFIKFVENLNYYLQQKIEPVDNPACNYPVGRLGDVEIHFVHYKDIEDARHKWEERCKRIKYDNLYIIMTDRDGCTEEIIRRFDNLPYKNKVLFTNREYKQYTSTFYIKGFENQPCIGYLYGFQNMFGKRYYDNFDYVKWFNNGA